MAGNLKEYSLDGIDEIKRNLLAGLSQVIVNGSLDVPSGSFPQNYRLDLHPSTAFRTRFRRDWK